MNFPQELVTRCEEAMSKVGPQGALRFLASGRATIEVVRDREILLDTIDGRPVREGRSGRIVTRGRKMGLAGSWALIPAGMVDSNGQITEKGRAFLKELDGTEA